MAAAQRRVGARRRGNDPLRHRAWLHPLRGDRLGRPRRGRFARRGCASRAAAARGKDLRRGGRRRAQHPLQRLTRMTTPLNPEAVHAELLALLRREAADFRLTRHDPVTTSAEAAAVRGAELRSGAKAMLVKTKAGFVLVVLAA